MKTILSLILFFISFGIFAQNISEINSDLNLSDSLTYETEVRIYQLESLSNHSTLFRMFKDESEQWTAEFYNHFANFEKPEEVKTDKKILISKNDMEFIYQNLLRSNILYLPSLNKIYWKLHERGSIEKVQRKYGDKIIDSYQWESKAMVVMDGEGYIIQVKGQKSNYFEFDNIDEYIKTYPEIDELIYMSEILNIIRDEFGIWKK